MNIQTQKLFPLSGIIKKISTIRNTKVKLFLSTGQKELKIRQKEKKIHLTGTIKEAKYFSIAIKEARAKS